VKNKKSKNQSHELIKHILNEMWKSKFEIFFLHVHFKAKYTRDSIKNENEE